MGNAPDARILRWRYQHVGIFWRYLTLKFASAPTPTPDASQWKIGGVGPSGVGAGVGHVHFMFFVLISFTFCSQRKPSFQWNMGHAEGGHIKFGGSFYTVARRFSHIKRGGCALKGGRREQVLFCLEGGAKSFGPAIFPFCRAPSLNLKYCACLQSCRKMLMSHVGFKKSACRHVDWVVPMSSVQLLTVVPLKAHIPLETGLGIKRK